MKMCSKHMIALMPLSINTRWNLPATTCMVQEMPSMKFLADIRSYRLRLPMGIREGSRDDDECGDSAKNSMELLKNLEFGTQLYRPRQGSAFTELSCDWDPPASEVEVSKMSSCQLARGLTLAGPCSRVGQRRPSRPWFGQIAKFVPTLVGDTDRYRCIDSMSTWGPSGVVLLSRVLPLTFYLAN
ncbi:hypothetical protein GW17_00029798 [Ensete ventricosum]|nr:hypothetical protein GW17_00029798 [Ensete ventricosum]